MNVQYLLKKVRSDTGIRMMHLKYKPIESGIHTSNSPGDFTQLYDFSSNNDSEYRSKNL